MSAESVRRAHNLRQLWAGEPDCCRDVECEVGSAVCRLGCHRIVEIGVHRQVLDKRTGSANPVWQGRIG